MYKHILVPTDGSPLSMKAVKAAAKLAHTTKARITALYVMPPFIPPHAGEAAIALNRTDIHESYVRAMKAEAQHALAKVQATATREKVKCESVQVVDHRPWDGIVRTAAARKCDLIVMASHGRRGIEGLLFGSETVKVLTHSKTPVLVCR
jgi:nucleotide-binding universal stress UspA family protein